ncbi:hypothetical protein BGX26_005093, partial [Mortierella sp. AD094]
MSQPLPIQSLHPLQLPEIRSHVSKLLSLKDLKSCMLVCREWSFDFTKPIWETFHLNEQRTRQIPFDVWLKYHVHVRTLIIRSPLVLVPSGDQGKNSLGWIFHPSHCPNLVDLRVVPGHIYESYLSWIPGFIDSETDLPEEQQPGQEQEEEQSAQTMTSAERKDRILLTATDRIMQTLDRTYHPNIRSFFWAVHPQIYNGRFWRQLLRTPPTDVPITSLTLASTKVDIEQLNSLLCQCPQLTALGLQYVNLVFGNSLTDTLDLSHVVSFTLERHEGSSRIPIKIQGSHLENLSVFMLVGNGMKFSSFNCPRLRNIYLQGLLETELGSVRQLLGQCVNTLESLKLENFQFRNDPKFIWDLAANHGTKLKKLSLKKSNGIESRDLQDLLANCEKLLDFHGVQQIIDADHIGPSFVPSNQLATWSAVPPPIPQGSSSWSCLNLVELSVAIRIPRHVDPLERHRLFSLVYSSLSPLVHLKTIDLSGGWCSIDRSLFFVGVPWTLKTGLNSLQLLSRVKRLVLTGWESDI